MVRVGVVCLIIPMSNIEFSTDSGAQFKSRAILGMPETPKMVNFLLKKNIVKNQTQAHYILLGICIVCFLIAISLPFITGSKKSTVSQEEMDNAMQQYKK